MVPSGKGDCLDAGAGCRCLCLPLAQTLLVAAAFSSQPLFPSWQHRGGGGDARGNKSAQCPSSLGATFFSLLAILPCPALLNHLRVLGKSKDASSTRNSKKLVWCPRSNCKRACRSTSSAVRWRLILIADKPLK